VKKSTTIIQKMIGKNKNIIDINLNMA